MPTAARLRLPPRVKPPYGSRLIRGHPLAQGLIGAWLFTEGGGLRIVNLGSELDRAAVGAAGALAWQASPFGPALDGDGSASYLTAGTRTTEPPFSIAAAFATPAPATGAAIVSINNPLSTDDQHALTLGPGDSKIAAMTRDTATFQSAISTTTVVANRWYQAVGVWAATNDRRIYLDGVHEATNTSSQTPIATPDTVNLLRLGDSSPNFYWGGQVAYVYLWDRELSPVEIAELAGNPYQMFAPPVWRRYFVPAAGGGAPPATRTSRLALLGVG